MTAAQLSVKGVKKTKATLKTINKKVIQELAASMKKAAFNVELSAKKYAPVDTGFLRSRISAQEIDPLKWKIVAATNYAAYVEYGTRKQRAQQYMRPAARKAQATLPKQINSSVRRIV